jgi:hypothetical protein
LSLSKIFSTEIFLIILKTFAHKTIENKNKINQNIVQTIYRIFGLFLIVINLYKLTIKIHIHKNTINPKNITENQFSSIFVVAGSSHTLESLFGSFIKFINIIINHQSTIIKILTHHIKKALIETLDQTFFT